MPVQKVPATRPLSSAAIAQFAVTAVEVAIPTVGLAGREAVSVQALAANGANVYIGETGVLSTTGWELAPGASIDLDASTLVGLFAVAASGTQRVGIFELAP